ncbi:MAG: lycopene cyclase domain-containing protein [Candidatus Pacearchaeota archaeon]
MEIFNEWLVFSLILLGVWLIVFLLGKNTRKEMFFVSLFTMPFGLTEPLFVPEYWNPPSLFNLAATTGFDIESLIFTFAVGGIGSVIYESIFKSRQIKMNKQEMHSKRHQYHLLALFSPVIVFILLFFLTKLNPIYSASIALFVGGIATILCRPDLKKEILYSGLIFLGIYFVFFLFFNLAYPFAVERFWNLSAISGILVLGVPLEELIFAMVYGLMWGSVYEHVLWYKAKRDN